VDRKEASVDHNPLGQLYPKDRDSLLCCQQQRLMYSYQNFKIKIAKINNNKSE